MSASEAAKLGSSSESGSDLALLGIDSLAHRIARKEASPVEVVRATLARIDRLNEGLKAYISVYPDEALACARRAEADIVSGNYLGPLHGVPLAVKDLFQVAGMKRTCGSRVIPSEVEREDATSVARLRAAGAVIVGTVNLHEFAFGPTGVNPHFGTARNPWDPDKVCGGSSSGSACAVAACLAAGALGSDTGGSIRIPASLCGVVGLKQTFGLASRHGIYPLCGAFDHGGPIARSVTDVALLLQAIAGADPRDDSTRSAPVADYTGKLGQRLAGIRVGLPLRFFFDELHPEVDRAVRAVGHRLSDLGAAVDEIELPFDADTAARAWDAIALSEAYKLHETHLRDHGEALSPDVRARLLRGAAIGPEQVVAAKRTRDEVKRQMASLMRTIDVLAIPSTPVPAVPVETGFIEVDGRQVDGVKVLGRLTRLAALTGQPAISLNCGFTGEGLPIGLQLVGAWFAEPDLLRVAYAYEQASPWRDLVPPAAP